MWLTPFFRYSASRDAYVLRGVGNQIGPVFKLGAAPSPAVSATADKHQTRR